MRCEDMIVRLLLALVLFMTVTAPLAALDGVDRRHHQRGQPKADVVPRSWIYQPPRADWKVNRYVSRTVRPGLRLTRHRLRRSPSRST